MEILSLHIFCLLILGHLNYVQGQAKLVNPPSRSSMWRYGFSTPRNTNDNRLNCGGINVLKANEGRCGICGDHFSRLPRPNEDGGLYATRTIGKIYDQGQTAPFTVEFNIGQKGYFEFRLCKLQSGVLEATQECLDKNLLPLVNGTTRMHVPATRFKKTTFQLVLPANLTCERCVVQWMYVTSHTWGCVPSEKECCFGCGIQEKYVNCADVKIRSTATTEKPTTTTPPSTTKRTTYTITTTTATTTSSEIATPVPSTTSLSKTTPPAPNFVQPPASTITAAEVHIQELLETQKAQLTELARLRKKIAEMASSRPKTTTTTTTKTPPTTTPASSDEPQNIQEFVQAFLSVTEKIHGNVPSSPNAMMKILRNVKLFEPVSTTPAPSRAEQFLETVLFPNTQSLTTTPPPPPPLPPAPPAQPQVQPAFASPSQLPSVNPFLPSMSGYPPVYPQSMGNNQMMPSMQSMQSMNAHLLGLNGEAQSMFEMQGNPLLGEPSETGLGGVMNPMALMTQMLLSQQQMPAVPQVKTTGLVASTISAQKPVKPMPATTPEKQVAPLAVVPVPSSTTVFTQPVSLVKRKPEPLTLDTLNDLQRAEILQKLKMANLILSKQAQPMSLDEKLKVYRMVIDKALLTFNKENEERLAKSSPLVLTEITQNNHLLNQQKQIEKLQLEIQRLKNQTLQTQSTATSKQSSVPRTEPVPKTASSVSEKYGNESPPKAPVSREPSTPTDIVPRRPVIPGTNVVHPLHSTPVDFTNVDPFTLMGLGALGSTGLLEPVIKCKFIGAGELEWACKRFCVPDVGGMSCSASPEFPQHKTKCAKDCAVL